MQSARIMIKGEWIFAMPAVIHPELVVIVFYMFMFYMNTGEHSTYRIKQ